MSGRPLMSSNRCAEPVDQYLQTFAWNKVKYRTDKPIVEMADTLRKVRLRLYISANVTDD